MRRGRYLLPALLIGVVLALGACGGDDDSDESATVQTPPATEIAPTGPTDANSGATTGQESSGKSERSEERRKRRSRRTRARERESSSSEQAESTESAETKQKAKQLATKIRNASTRKYQADVSYDAARKVCRTSKLKDLRSFHKFKGNDPEVIARAIAKNYTPKFRREAAYNGCIKGLSQR